MRKFYRQDVKYIGSLEKSTSRGAAFRCVEKSEFIIIFMPKEKIQADKIEAQELAMARRVLGTVKELPMSEAEKAKLMELIDQAKQLETENKLHQAIVVYNQAAGLMRKIKARNENQVRTNPKESWDWQVGEKLLLDDEGFIGPKGFAQFDTAVFTTDGETVLCEVSDQFINWLAKNGKTAAETVFKSKQLVASNDGQHFAALVLNTADGDEDFYEVVTDKGKGIYKSSEACKKLMFSPDGEKLAVFVKDEVSSPSDQYYKIVENGQLLFPWIYGDPSDPKDYRLKDIIYSPDSQKRAAIIHGLGSDFSDANEVSESIVVDGDKKWQPQAATLKWPVYSPDGEKLAVVDREGQIMVNEKYIEILSGKKALSPPVFSPNGEKIAYVVSLDPRKTSFTLAEDDKIKWEHSMFKEIRDFVYSDDGQSIAAVVINPSEEANEIKIAVNGINIDDDEYINVKHLTFSPDGQKIMYVGQKDDGKYFRIVKDVSDYAKIQT